MVDVLSFSTSVTVAVERGMQVFPFRWKGPHPHNFAAQHDAVLAVGRLEARKSGSIVAPSLSPASLLECVQIPRLVLPSPNGSTIVKALRTPAHPTIVAGCLRNADSVAEFLTSRLEAQQSVAVIAAGERWLDDDSLRPAVEDHLGAGAIVAAPPEAGFADRLSPEALTAAQLFEAARNDLTNRMHNRVGGRELTSGGFETDVEVAADLNASRTIPVLTDGAFSVAQ